MLVMQREYLSIVAKKSFIISTLLAPVIMLALVAIPALLMTVNNSDSRLISIIDETGQYSDIFKDNDDYRFRIETDMTPENMKDRYKKADGDIYAIVVIPSDVEESKTINVYSEKPVKITLSRELEEPLNKSLSDAKIASYNLPELKDMIAQSDVEVKIRSHTWDEEGEKVSSSEIAMIVGLFLAFLTYMFVLMYGAMIMGSVVEDKTNRIVEVIVSTCRPMELMLGKIVSIALVGLTQILIWAVFLGIGLFVVSMFGIATSTPDIAAGMTAGTSMPEMPTSEVSDILQAVLGINWFRLLGIFILYFIGGYLLYAALFAGFGSAVDQQSDANQFTMPIMMIIILALVIGQACMENPDGTLGVIASLVPFTSPIVMMIRLPYDVPAWQILTSLLLLYGTALLFVFLASRIYRTGILMYGRKVSFKEIIRWIK
ncbi:ABC transporter permease [Heminiphilus faecis]|uniref:ABC transporter permease n=1 Tax=Heminiphilus faecis TaxID=2601703 RepID=A0ABV4CV35_9BACT|nr:ABC transporter permease [Heminiphilus faecis]